VWWVRSFRSTKAIEGLVLYAFNKGDVCTCPSRALIQRDIFNAFMDRALHRIGTTRQGNPLDTDTQFGAQVSAAQLNKIESYVQIGLDEGARGQGDCRRATGYVDRVAIGAGRPDGARGTFDSARRNDVRRGWR
jgi:acyl-CoA reductase-like NAD-dependent aldehyde dehydrogenase